MGSHQETIRYYDHNAETYQSRIHARYDREALKEFSAKLTKESVILDAGCGTGRDLEYFRASGFSAEGFDGSQKMVELAKKNSGAHIWQADFMFLTLARDKYDGIWANRSLIHLPPSGCQRVVANFFAATKPRGFLFVSIEERRPDDPELTEDRHDDPLGPTRQIFRYTRDDFGSLLRQNGFQTLAEGRNLENPTRIGFLCQSIKPRKKD